MSDIIEDHSTDSSEPSINEYPSAAEDIDQIHSTGINASADDDFDKNSSRTDEDQEITEDLTKLTNHSPSLLQTFVTTSHILTTVEARKRNFLVGSARTHHDDTVNDINTYFPGGRPLTVMVVTWNTGEASKLYEQNYTPTAKQTAQPKERMLDDISDILLPTFIEHVSDLIIVCTQEMSSTKKRSDWEILLQEVIGPTHVLFHSIHFGSLSLCIFLRRELIWFCTEPEENIVKFRAVNPRRTKGSLIVNFNLFGTSFMIINSHFEAGDTLEGRANRHSNFQNTLTKVPSVGQIHPNSGHLHSDQGENNQKPKTNLTVPPLNVTNRRVVDISKSYDCVFWAGDMNFRIGLPFKEVKDLIKEKNFDKLLLNDEFHSRKSKIDDIYHGFEEAEIRFAPTYKFDLRHDDDFYAQHRTPSFTDRILYRDKSNSNVKCTQYTSVEHVKHSDHKPVLAHFQVKLKPGLHAHNLSYGKFNHEVYRRGCRQRERHHSLGIDHRGDNRTRSNAMTKSAVCVVQ